MKKILAILLVIVISVALLIYLSSSKTKVVEETEQINTQTETLQPAVEENVVYLSNFKFVPETIKIKKGDTVKWVNQDTAGHDIKIGQAVTSPVMKRDESFTYTFGESGEFDYICGLHPVMKGKIIVE